MTLDGIKVVVAISGGIAAYKIPLLLRLLRKQGAEVRVITTANALQFVTAMTLQALSGNKVHLHESTAEDELHMGHIALARWTDYFIVTPATANTIAKLAHGLADDLLTTTALVATCPKLIVPAMNYHMWQAAVTRENVLQLQRHGWEQLGPESGSLACGDEGSGRMAEPEQIVVWLQQQRQTEQLLANVHVTITAGPTREPIDPVRYISNRSSGKMGFAIAAAAQRLGAVVRLVTGPVQLPTPFGVERVDVETAEQMYQVVQQQPGNIFIAVAAVADFRLQTVASQKIKKDAIAPLLLQPNRDILATVAQLPPQQRPYCVGFAAETENLDAYAQHKLATKAVNMIIANRVGINLGFDSDMNEVDIYWQQQHLHLPMAPKTELAATIMQTIAAQYQTHSRAK